jgi:ribosome modulation factor
MNCYAEGYNAFTVGMRLTENPYSELEKRSEWSKGWLSAKKKDPIYPNDCY